MMLYRFRPSRSELVKREAFYPATRAKPLRYVTPGGNLNGAKAVIG